MKKWKIGVAAIAAVAALALGGCGNNQSGSNSKNVTMWIHVSNTDPEGKALQKNINDFNKENKHGYKAKVQFIPRSGSGGGYEDKINAALNSGSLPDVISLDGPNTAAYAHSKIIQPVGKYISNKGDLLQTIKNQGTYKGKMYAVGYSESSIGFYYNKKMFKEAGVKPSEIPTLEKPWNWNQFEAVCKKITDHFHEPAINMSLNDHSEMSLYSLAPLMWSAGGSITNPAGTKAVGYFNSKQTTSAFQFIQDMVKKGYTTISPKDKGFETGKYAMLMSGTWEVQTLQNQYKNLDWGVLPYPVSPKTNKEVSPTGSWQYAMTSAAKNKKAAGALINFLVNKKCMYRSDMANTVLPARKSVSKMMMLKVGPAMKFFIKQNQTTGHARPVLVNYPQVTRTFAETVQDVTLYKKNPNVQKVMNNQAKVIQKYLKK
ncbi:MULTISPECIES: sugar ABC transporter substrate-binding protein [Lactobacillus]|uniref:Sugar ABC transporter substrate-binding protein n=1 Tax=Lactobacillus xujianguonis TaxID=2495899 RepID=A0A437SW51_9LACO|nr:MULTISPECIES: sugar ABC transporter substrate-binding protein [Lactobacillus]RVU71122.1 sugar ABC transporter substrate-binding protein [Lactobacillus xujianguonis]RVU77470.1 sugar ABC transporter substrate-binding protein [Lactobacillus xujianguonis]